MSCLLYLLHTVLSVCLLQSELLKCKDIHDTAKESKGRIEQMQKDCLTKIDKNNRQLTYKHEQEVS
jgi:hypothetical protein